MLTAAQQAIRRSGITATDVRVLSGLDPHGRTAHDIYASKVLGVDNYETTEEKELGDELEPIVIRRLASKKGLRLVPREPDAMTIRHPTIAHHVATPDAFFSDSIGQVKVVGLHNAHLWGEDEADGIPDYVLAQCAWEMHVSGSDVEHVGALTGTHVLTFTIVRSRDGIDDLIGALVDEADRFWTDHVLARVPPPIDGSDGSKRLIAARWPRHREGMIKASADVELSARRYFEAKRRRDEAADAVELASQNLKALTGDAEGIDGDGWRLMLRWRGPTSYTVEKEGYRHFDLRAKGAGKKKGKAA